MSEYEKNPTHLVKQETYHDKHITGKFQKADKQIVSYRIASVEVVYDGTNYNAILKRENMSGDGYLHWQESHKTEIATCKSMCYAQHIAKFGFSNQVAPNTTEHTTVSINLGKSKFFEVPMESKIEPLDYDL